MLKIASLNELKEKTPYGVTVNNLDLVLVKDDQQVHILYGRCLHRGALLADGHVEGQNLICGLHGWDFRYDTGVSEYNNHEALHKFKTIIKEDTIFVEESEIDEYLSKHPQPFQRDQYLGKYADTHPESTEPYAGTIQQLARHDLSKTGHHGESGAMGVDRNTLPKWDSLQYLPAQLWKKPLADDASVITRTVIGPRAKKPLTLEIPVFVSDMSFGALSREAKLALAKGANLAGTGICSGEGGMLPDEQKSNERYFYEYASGKFGFSIEKVKRSQAFHFKAGQGAKTGTGGHLPGNKVTPEIAEVRGLKPGETAISPPSFSDLTTPADFRIFADEIRRETGGIPIGFKMAASHLEQDLAFALEAGADYIILDGRGGGTGSAPLVLRDHINVPTIPALARARKFLDGQGVSDVTLVITGGLRLAPDFAKALMLGADAIAISNSALQAIGCLGMRACHTNNCPVGIATQKENLRARLQVEQSAKMLANYLGASNDLMKVIARAMGYDDFSKFNREDLVTFDSTMAQLTGVQYAGV